MPNAAFNRCFLCSSVSSCSGGGSGRPVNPNTHDPNSGLPLGAKEKWARTYENTWLIRDENLLAEYENYLSVYQAVYMGL